MNIRHPPAVLAAAGLIATLAATAPAHAAVEPEAKSPPPLVSPMFQDHAVLQRERANAIWGWAHEGEPVEVRLEGPVSADLHVNADKTGRWSAQLPRLTAGGPYEITVTTASRSQRLQDLLSGDVWLCSGQSNMALEVRRTLDSREEILEAANDSIRLLTIPMQISVVPLEQLPGPVSWQPASPASVADFSAACFYFARELQKTVRVPMGLIHSSWGGSSIQAWMSPHALQDAGGEDERLQVLGEYAVDPAAGNRHWGAIWESWWRERMKSSPWLASVDDRTWPLAPRGLGYWELWGVPELAHFDGMVWFRTSFELTAAQAAQPATLSLGAVDEIDATWLNGHWVGSQWGPDSDRDYVLPRGVLKKGRNVVAVNALDTYGFGGMHGPPDKRALHLQDGTSVPLQGDWRYQVVPATVGKPLRQPWEPVAGVTVIRNAMIAPLGPFGLKGALWYQGESNTNDAQRYAGQLRALMTDWRAQFSPDLPFLIVQLANYGPPPTSPTESGWASLREAQRQAVLADEHAGLAIAVDIGDRYDIHPANKQELGRRLARAARHHIYGENIIASGPTPLSAHREGSTVVVQFSNIEAGLVAYSGSHPIGFELCGGEPGSCQYVDAIIAADRIELQIPPGANPARVRFCWADSPVCTLFDRSGLPAGPFEMPLH